jgi:hypothetical protein
VRNTAARESTRNHLALPPLAAPKRALAARLRQKVRAAPIAARQKVRARLEPPRPTRCACWHAHACPNAVAVQAFSAAEPLRPRRRRLAPALVATRRRRRAG